MVASVPPALPADSARQARHFLLSFMALSVVSGLAIGMGRVVTTFYALSLGANNAQIGLIFSAEALTKMLVTVPAGFLIFRFGAKRVYSTATVGSMLLTLAMGLAKGWLVLGVLRALVGLCVPFRVVAMNSAFLQRLKDIGSSRAGWYRGAQSIGLLLLAPTIGGLLVAHVSYWVSFAVISACFAFMALYSRTFLPQQEQVAATPGEPVAALPQLWHMLRDFQVGQTCFIEFISSATNALFTTFVIVLAVNVIGLSEQQAVVLLTVQGASMVVCLFVLGSALRGLSSGRIYLGALPLMCAALALLSLSHSLGWLMLAAALLGLASAVVHMQNVVEISACRFSKNKVAGLYNLAGMAGTLIGASAGGVISLYTGLQRLFLLWIMVLLGAAIACVIARTRVGRARE